MVKEYLAGLAEIYFYQGNWHPNIPIDIGCYTSVQTGFKAWIKDIFEGHNKQTRLIKSLHEIMTNHLDGLETARLDHPQVELSHCVETKASADVGVLEITASKAGGFYGVLYDMYEIRASQKSLKEAIEKDKITDKFSSAALVVGTTYASGTIAVFGEAGATATLSGLPLLGNGKIDISNIDLHNTPLKLSLEASHNNKGSIKFQSEENLPLMPFVELYTVRKNVNPGGVFEVNVPKSGQVAYKLNEEGMRKRGQNEGPVEYVRKKIESKPSISYDIMEFSYLDYKQVLK